MVEHTKSQTAPDEHCNGKINVAGHRNKKEGVAQRKLNAKQQCAQEVHFPHRFQNLLQAKDLH